MGKSGQSHTPATLPPISIEYEVDLDVSENRFISLTGFEPRTVQAVAFSLNRLSYRGLSCRTVRCKLNCLWVFRFSEMLHSIGWYLVKTFRDNISPIFRGKAVQEDR